MRYMLASLVVGICLAATCDSRACDYTVTRGTAIESQRPIWLLILEAGVGAINGARLWKGDEASSKQKIQTLVSGGQNVSTALHIDGSPAPGIRGVARAAWRLGAFVVWNADGTIERRTRATVRGHSVTIDDRVENGRVWVRVVIGPPLGDPRVRCAILELTADERSDMAGWNRGPFGGAGVTASSSALRNRARIQLSCSAQIDLPGDRCRLVRRIATRIAEREAGPELTGRVLGLADAGRLAVLAGRSEMTEIVSRYIERMCNQ
jgi:hypothetical protein